jgi:hypothetical protein
MKTATVERLLRGCGHAPGAADDIRFFATHRRRHVRIRVPMPAGEHDAEFMMLGDHNVLRRRIIAFRGHGGLIPRIPFLLHADEEIADNDAILRPIIDELMGQAAHEYSLPVPNVGRA